MKEIDEHLSKIKSRKAPGPNGLKNELLKSLSNSRIFKEIIIKCFNDILNGNEVPVSWKSSKTKMIPKIRKPCIKDLRPIALINSTYKLYMAIIKSKIENHIELNNNKEDLQSGFTKHRQVEDNMFLLNYCINESFRLNKQLIVTCIDFSKAFDSIKRSSLIKALKDYKIHPDIINSIFKIYNDDNTEIFINDDRIAKIDISSGIRQGCNGSTTLFKLVTYIIIKELKKTGFIFKNGKFSIPLLFFADDGLLLSNTKEEAQRYIKKLHEVAGKCGLKVNELKSNILVYNKKEEFEEIENIEVTDSVKYLGVKICNKKDCFSDQKNEIINTANKLSNVVPAIIYRSSNRLLIGKVFWKNVVVPKLLFAITVIPLNEDFICKLQRIENKTYRSIFCAPRYTPICALRGEIGSSIMKSRIHKNKMNYVKHLLNTENDLLKNVAKSIMTEKRSPWGKEIDKIVKYNRTSIDILANIDKIKVKKIVMNLDEENWQREISEKSTLNIYAKSKFSIQEENIYDNSQGSVLLFRCRTNTMPLNDRNRHIQGNTCCPCCNYEIENLLHFLLYCPAYSSARSMFPLLNQPYEEDTDFIISRLLLFNKEEPMMQLNIKKYLCKIFLIRKRKIENT